MEASSGVSGTIYGSTIARNESSGNGGAIAANTFYGGSLVIDESTVSDNHSASSGGGVWANNYETSTPGGVTVGHSTIIDNSAGDEGGGVWFDHVFGDSSTIRQTIIARNAANDEATSDIRSNLPLIALYDLFGNGSESGLAEAPLGSPDSNGNLIGGTVHGVIDPKFGPLVYNGGRVFLDGSRMLTHAPLPGSPAIDAGGQDVVTDIAGAITADERGEPFVRVFGGWVDIGAVESQPNPLPGDYNFDGVVDAADYSVWRDTLGSTTDLRADGDASGSVDASDYGFWKSRFGNVFFASGAGNGATAALVEPVALGLRQAKGGIRATTFDIAPGSPAASPGIARPSPVEKLSAVVARQDLLLEAWSVTRSDEHRQHG